MRDPVAALLDPRSVAVVGASQDPLKRGYQAIHRLQADGFPHPIYPVNPRVDRVLGLPAYPSVEAIGHPVDLAFVVTPAAQVPDVLRSCGRAGVTAAAVIAVGFGELGARGQELEDEVAHIAAEYGIHLVGPNTGGVFNLPVRFNLLGVRDVPLGEVALVCQSGNIALSVFSEAAHASTIGFSIYVGIGNEAGLRYHELLPYLRDDANTHAVLMYAEGFRDGRAFLATAAEIGRSIPVVLYKAGRTEAARRSALSHTGAIAGSPHVTDMLLRQAGVILVERSDELVPVCEAVLRQPPMRGPRVAVLSDGGGHATVAADALDRSGLELAELSEPTRRRLADLLMTSASTDNPVDVAGATDRDPTLFEACAEALVADPQVDGLLCVGLLGGYGIRFSSELAAAEERAAQAMADRAAAADTALVVQSAYVHARPPAHQLLRHAGVPVHGSVETAARCMVALWDRGRALATADQRSTFAVEVEPRTHGRWRVLTEPAGRERLARHGLQVSRWRLAADADGAARAAAEFDGPVALKIVSPDVVHKSDVGGVLLDVSGPDAARHGFDEVVGAVRAAQPDAQVDGVLVTPMAPTGVELLVGAATDPTFGPVLTVGAGGTEVELHQDVAFRAIPVTALECREMLDELAVTPLLDGPRGTQPLDRTEIVDLLLAVSRLVQTSNDVVELDLNPVVAHGDGLDLVDVRVVIGDPPAGNDEFADDQKHECVPVPTANGTRQVTETVSGR